VEKGAAFTIGVVETDFFDGVEFTVPNEPFGVNFAAKAIEGKADRNGFGYFLGHESLYFRRRPEVKREKLEICCACARLWVRVKVVTKGL